MKKLDITISQRQPDGKKIMVEGEMKVKTQVGTDEEIAEMLLEAEQHGNDGGARVHIFAEQ